MSQVLQLHGISKRFGAQRVVDNAQLTVRAAEIAVLVGPSGCGKSTLLRLICGLETPEPSPEGEIIIGDTVVWSARARVNVPPERRRVGMVFQDYALFPHLTVAENVAFGLSRLPRAQRQSRVREMLEWVRLSDYASRYPHELSGGQQQRVALARAVAPDPALLLLDEPFSNLDYSLRAELREEMRQLLKARNVAALFVTHDREEALSLADTVMVMYDGHVLAADQPSAIYWQPATLQVAQMLGELNALPAEARGQVARCALGEVALSTRASGRGLVLIRPEMIHVQADAQGNGVVEEVVFFGHDQLVQVRLDDGTALKARLLSQPTNGHTPLSSGVRVRAYLHPISLPFITG